MEKQAGRPESYLAILLKEFQQVNINVLFSQNKDMPIEVSDRGAMGLPNVIIRQMNRLGYKTLSSQEPNRYDALEKAGFRIDRNVDIWKILCGKQGGHYVDVGTSKKIGDGLVSSATLFFHPPRCIQLYLYNQSYSCREILVGLGGL